MSEAAQPMPDVSSLDAEDGKEYLRRIFSTHRKQQHPHTAGQHGESCRAFTEHALQAVGTASSVAAYVSVGAEPCTRLLLDALEEQGVRVLLPVLGPGLERNWAYFRGAEDLEVRAPGRPPEPGGEVLPAEAVGEVEALLIPALAIDRAGNRLGQGGGWYDRVVPLKQPEAHVFALAHPDELHSELLPAEPHDMPVEAVITSDEWFLLEGSAFSRQ